MCTTFKTKGNIMINRFNQFTIFSIIFVGVTLYTVMSAINTAKK